MPVLISLLLCAFTANVSQAKRRRPSSDVATPAQAGAAPAPSTPPPVAAPPASQSTAAPVQPAPVAVPIQPPASAPVPPPAGSEAEISENRSPSIRPALYVLYNTGTQFRFDTVNATVFGETVSGNASYTFEMAPGLGVEFSQTRPNGWGWMAGLAYSVGRSLKSARVNLGGTTTTATYAGSSTKLTIFELDANARYRWSSLYVPFGFNYIVPNLSGSSYSIRGDVGMQVGLGVQAADHVALELYAKVYAMKATLASGGVSANLGTGYMTSLQINAKYDF